MDNVIQCAPERSERSAAKLSQYYLEIGLCFCWRCLWARGPSNVEHTFPFQKNLLAQAPSMLMRDAREICFLWIYVPGFSVNIDAPWATIISYEVYDLSTWHNRPQTCFKLILTKVVRFLCVYFYDWKLNWDVHSPQNVARRNAHIGAQSPAPSELRPNTLFHENDC